MYVNDIPIVTGSITQERASVSVTEAEFYAATECVLDMLYVAQSLEAIELEVEYPMKLSTDNMGTKDIANSKHAHSKKMV